ncbi:MAG: ABC transporter permease [Candidatus Hydrogenedentes bacterium]|nr:ABC transporter permease [Candidatus Hydrogenedentota bacterium]
MTETRIACPDKLNQDTGRSLLDEVRSGTIAQGGVVVLDLSPTESVDSRGGAWLVEIADYVHSQKSEFRVEGQQGLVAEFIDLIQPGLAERPERAQVKMGFFEGVGDEALGFIGELRQARRLLVEAIYWTLLGPFQGRGFRWANWTDEVYEMGVKAIRITFMMNFLLGLIISMLSAAQIEPFGLGIYVADLLVIAFARELAAVMTAVVVSARTGAAIAAELATMQVQEEIDALRSMGLNVSQFLVAPKILALVVCMPCLTALGMIAGILGGSIWGIFVLDITPDVWFHETLQSAHVKDVVQGLLKAVFFAVTIVLVGCHNGFRVRGGSRGVGLMTTRAVVADIFCIIVIDMIFALVFYYLMPAKL